MSKRRRKNYPPTLLLQPSLVLATKAVELQKSMEKLRLFLAHYPMKRLHFATLSAETNLMKAKLLMLFHHLKNVLLQYVQILEFVGVVVCNIFIMIFKFSTNNQPYYPY